MYTTRINMIKDELESRIDLEYKQRVKEYYQMDVSQFWGVRLPVIREISKRHFKILENKAFYHVRGYCELMLQREVYEFKVIAFDWCHRCLPDLEARHFHMLENWLVQYVNDWSDCDDICTHALGKLLMKCPEHMAVVKAWSHQKTRWLRRAAAVSLIPGLRKGQFLDDAFDLSLLLFKDDDDLVQKGCGWMLKDASKAFPDEVMKHVLAHRDGMPRTTLRYAIERYDQSQRSRALGKD